jgi:hypothetical protein
MPTKAKRETLTEDIGHAMRQHNADIQATAKAIVKLLEPTFEAFGDRMDAMRTIFAGTVRDVVTELLSPVTKKIDAHDKDIADTKAEVADLKVTAKNHEQRIIDLERKRHG